MKKIIFILCLFIAAPAIEAAVIHFDRVTTYTDGTPIAPEKIPLIQYRGYSGPNSANPDVLAGSVTDNLTITAPDPPAGGTLWYTVDATLDGMESAKAAAMSKTIPFQTPAGPNLRGVD